MACLRNVPDLTRDSLLSISTFLSLRQVHALRQVCKQFGSWLSDLSSFSWKKRIECAFPYSHQALLKADRKTQIAKLRIFDTLVHEGHRVSFFELAGLLDVASVEVNSTRQIPWAHNLFIIVHDKTKGCLFDSVSGRIACRLDFEELGSIQHVLFDVKSRFKFS